MNGLYNECPMDRITPHNLAEAAETISLQFK